MSNEKGTANKKDRSGHSGKGCHGQDTSSVALNVSFVFCLRMSGWSSFVGVQQRPQRPQRQRVAVRTRVEEAAAAWHWLQKTVMVEPLPWRMAPLFAASTGVSKWARRCVSRPLLWKATEQRGLQPEPPWREERRSKQPSTWAQSYGSHQSAAGSSSSLPTAVAAVAAAARHHRRWGNQK